MPACLNDVAARSRRYGLKTALPTHRSPAFAISAAGAAKNATPSPATRIKARTRKRKDWVSQAIAGTASAIARPRKRSARRGG